MWFLKKNKKPLIEKLTPAQYEQLAERYLLSQGYKIAERNFRLRNGEIDLVAQFGNEVVFVEVRMRASADFGRPEETVNAEKQARIRKVAAMYLNGRSMTANFVPRFDVIAILHPPGGEPHIEHFTDAF